MQCCLDTIARLISRPCVCVCVERVISLGEKKNSPEDEEETGSCSSCYEGKHIKGGPDERIDRPTSLTRAGCEGGGGKPKCERKKEKKKNFTKYIDGSR